MYFAAFNYMPVICLIALPLVPLQYSVPMLLITALQCVIVANFGTVMQWLYSKKRPITTPKTIQEFHLDSQFHREQVTNHYLTKRYVIPESLLSTCTRPSIICVAPHGVVPWGNTGVQSKLFGNRGTKWAAAPILFSIPPLLPILRQYGAFPANKAGIMKTLQDGYNAGVVLDGIAGMFAESSEESETLKLIDRKAICAIALKAGCDIIPGYCFGAGQVATVLKDPFGLLEYASITLDISLTPFVGRWGIPMGPPRRKPLLFAYGEPLQCTAVSDEDLPKAVEKKHGELLAAFTHLFNAHKAAYGWGAKVLRFG